MPIPRIYIEVADPHTSMQPWCMPPKGSRGRGDGAPLEGGAAEGRRREGQGREGQVKRGERETERQW